MYSKNIEICRDIIKSLNVYLGNNPIDTLCDPETGKFKVINKQLVRVFPDGSYMEDNVTFNFHEFRICRGTDGADVKKVWKKDYPNKYRLFKSLMFKDSKINNIGKMYSRSQFLVLSSPEITVNDDIRLRNGGMYKANTPFRFRYIFCNCKMRPGIVPLGKVGTYYFFSNCTYSGLTFHYPDYDGVEVIPDIMFTYIRPEKRIHKKLIQDIQTVIHSSMTMDRAVA